MKNIVVLGSTGSVGTAALEVAAAFPDRFRVIGLAARRSVRTLAAQARRFAPRFVAVTDPGAREEFAGLLPDRETEVIGQEALLDVLGGSAEADVVLNAMSGMAGLLPTLAVLSRGGTVALANKEPIVAAGHVLMKVAAENGGRILPVDSEHCAVFQARRAGSRNEIRRILLTASGGPFRERPLDTFSAITPEEALRHPTWKMGPKITIDSATMMNKALEIIEAVHLFGVEPGSIRVLLHPQAIVHSMVEFRDGSVIAQLARPDMRLPILFALSWPERLPYGQATLSLEDLSELSFGEPDPVRYPALALGRRAAEEGGLAGAVLNAASERAVEHFLAGSIPFPAIVETVAHVFDGHEPGDDPTLEDVLLADRRSRAEVDRCLNLS